MYIEWHAVRDDFVSIFDAIRPLLQKMYPDEFGTPEQFAKYIEDVRQETLSKIDPRPGLWYAVCARKPLWKELEHPAGLDISTCLRIRLAPGSNSSSSSSKLLSLMEKE